MCVGICGLLLVGGRQLRRLIWEPLVTGSFSTSIPSQELWSGSPSVQWQQSRSRETRAISIGDCRPRNQSRACPADAPVETQLDLPRRCSAQIGNPEGDYGKGRKYISTPRIESGCWLMRAADLRVSCEGVVVLGLTPL